MPKPACIRCQRFLRPAKNGIHVLEMAPIERRAASGTAEPDKWRPYKVWQADKWVCEGCGVELITGWARIATESYHDNFQQEVALCEVIINDC